MATLLREVHLIVQILRPTAGEKHIYGLLLLVSLMTLCQHSLPLVLLRKQVTVLSGQPQVYEYFIWHALRFFSEWLQCATPWGGDRLLRYGYRKVKTWTHHHVVHLGYDFHTKQDAGKLKKAINDGESFVDFVHELLFTLAPTVIRLVWYSCYIIQFLDRYEASIIFTICLSAIVLNLSTSGWLLRHRKKYLTTHREEREVIDDQVSHIRTIVHCNQIESEHQHYQTTLAATRDPQERYFYGFYIVQYLQNVIAHSAPFYLGLLALHKDQLSSEPTNVLLKVYTLTEDVLSVTLSINESLTSLGRTLVDFEHWRALVAEPQRPPATIGVKHIGGEICLIDVSFSRGDRRVLHHIDIVIQPGQTVAIVGKSGCGKSTLLELIMGLYDVSSGKITKGGHNVQSIPRNSLRGDIISVPQQVEPLNRSFRQILTCMRPDTSDEVLSEAVRDTSLKQRINGDYEAKVGTGGKLLSGGERQRLLLATALITLRQPNAPSVLMLDEATSGLDSSTEQSILQKLKDPTGKRTTIMVAHRLSTTRHADVIYVLDEGKVSGIGTHRELLQAGGIYAELWFKQTGAAS